MNAAQINYVYIFYLFYILILENNRNLTILHSYKVCFRTCMLYTNYYYIIL